MIQQELHNKIVKNSKAICDWYEKQKAGLTFPIYSSFDVRDSGCKVVPVDANLFPAGFNNICQVDKDNAPEIMRAYLQKHYPGRHSQIGLLAEEHTSNSYYWDNVSSIADIIGASGADVEIFLPQSREEPLNLKTASGRDVVIYGSENRNGEIFVNNKKLDLIVCNNDFSNSYEIWSDGLKTPMNPPREMGWFKRRKHSFFEHYNRIAGEFAQINQVDPAMLQVKTELFTDFDINDQDRIEALALRVDNFIQELKKEYLATGVKTEPFCFVKNNAGTYGLAVLMVQSGEDIRAWNSKTRSKMKAAKGGRKVTELIIQEGVLTRVRDDQGVTAEPCIYMVGEQLVGGFLRTHGQKGPSESLNSPGAVFKRLCMSDLVISASNCELENVYGWISKLSVLALAHEFASADVQFVNYEL